MVPQILELLVVFLVGEESHSHGNCSCSAHQRSIFTKFQEIIIPILVHRPRLGRQNPRTLQVVLLTPPVNSNPLLHDISTVSLTTKGTRKIFNLPLAGVGSLHVTVTRNFNIVRYVNAN